ncbi:hypothetical protein [Ramlibacter montanisoli]|uniref:hypothetical protein n=1 Tax=Ramlibacter montanisoli TaxID=2732512 RepID=UPI002815C706|nr:hypothetical protein [Ramlibacter montanisoli]
MKLPSFPRGRLLAAALACSIALGTPARAQLPAMGEGGEMNVAAERKLGERIARELYRDPDYIDDPVLVEYIQGIWQPLLAGGARAASSPATSTSVSPGRCCLARTAASMPSRCPEAGWACTWGW